MSLRTMMMTMASVRALASLAFHWDLSHPRRTALEQLPSGASTALQPLTWCPREALPGLPFVPLIIKVPRTAPKHLYCSSDALPACDR